MRKSWFAGCLEARYCSTHCQGADWNSHGIFCKEIMDQREKEKLGLVKSIDGKKWEAEEGHNARCDYQKNCWNCYLEDENYSLKSIKTLLCTGCRRAWYCNKDCQEEDWGRHRKFCQAKTNKRLLNEFKFLSTRIFV